MRSKLGQWVFATSNIPDFALRLYYEMLLPRGDKLASNQYRSLTLLPKHIVLEASAKLLKFGQKLAVGVTRI